MHKSNGKYYINCCDCDKEFEVGKNTYYKTNIDRYCLKCRLKRINASKSQRKYIILKCEDCSKEFLIEQKRAQQRYQKYTKHLCTSCSKKGDKNPFYDKTFTEQQKQSLSNIRTAYYNDEQYGIQRRQEVSVRTTGSNNPMYKGAEFVSNYTWRSKNTSL